jgi:predicted GTPase
MAEVKVLYKPIKRTIVLLGHTGAGKSRLANFLLQSNDFHVANTLRSVTKGVAVAERLVKMKEMEVLLQVVDTQGLADTTMTDKEVLDIITKSLDLNIKKVHYFVILISRGRLTDERREALESIIKRFELDTKRKSNVLFVVSNCESLNTRAFDEMRKEYLEDRTVKKILWAEGKNLKFVGLPNDEDMNQLIKEAMLKLQEIQKENLFTIITKKVAPVNAIPGFQCNIL